DPEEPTAADTRLADDGCAIAGAIANQRDAKSVEVGDDHVPHFTALGRSTVGDHFDDVALRRDVMPIVRSAFVADSTTLGTAILAHGLAPGPCPNRRCQTHVELRPVDVQVERLAVEPGSRDP